MKVSVVITSYNLAEYIVDCIESVLQQNSAVDEIILADDASTDDTVDLARISCRKLIVIEQERNGGALFNTLAGLNRSTGDIVAFIDGDDTWPANKIQAVMQGFSDPNVILVTHNHRRVNSVGMPTGEIDETHRNLQKILQLVNKEDRQIAMRRAALYREGLWFGSAYSLRRSAINFSIFNKIVGSNINSKNAYLDLVLAPFVVLSNPDGDIAYLHDVVFDYRLHSNNSASGQTLEKQMRAINRGRSTNELTRTVLMEIGANHDIIEKYDTILLEYSYLTALYTKKRVSALFVYFKLINFFVKRKILFKETVRLIVVLFLGVAVFLRLKGNHNSKAKKSLNGFRRLFGIAPFL